MFSNTPWLPCECPKATRTIRIQRKEKWVVTEEDLGKIHPQDRIWCRPWQEGTFLLGRKRVAFQARKVWGHRSRITQDLFIQVWLTVGKLLIPVCLGFFWFLHQRSWVLRIPSVLGKLGLWVTLWDKCIFLNRTKYLCTLLRRCWE